ncbi:unnamed protein product [marine sediment metagenome]|uniref:Radical SAM core domain-containing protein n=1 Tax=marine sediment metagenome TaxID=412755 RepID=X0YSY6_9ZZZZ
MNNEDVPLTHAGMALEFELQKQYYNECKIYILQIESTLRCPQLCDYCYAGSTPDSPQGMSSEKIKELLDTASKLDIRMIDWLGGDPLVRKDWYELCKYASNLGLINNIWTSGIPLANAEIAEKAVEVSEGGFISTHLDTFNPELLVQSPQFPGSLEGSLKSKRRSLLFFLSIRVSSLSSFTLPNSCVRITEQGVNQPSLVIQITVPQ